MNDQPPPDFRALFETAPMPLVVLAPPEMTIVAVNDAYLDATMTRRGDIVGRTLFDVFRGDPDAGAVHNLRMSLERVLASRRRDVMAVQRHPIPRPLADDSSVERWWSPINSPLLDKNGNVELIIHRMEDVTELARLRSKSVAQDQIARDQRQLIARLRESEAALRESEMRLAALVGASAQVLYRMSPDWSEMRQLSGGGFIVDTPRPDRNWLRKYIHPDDQPDVLAKIREAIRTKSVFEYGHRVIRADGSLGWTYSRAVPILDPDGKLVEWFGAASDVTEQKEAEKALRESEERFRQFAEAAPDVLWIRDAGTLEMEYLSPAFETVFGQSREQATGEWLSLIHPDDRSGALAAMERVRGGERVTQEFRLLRTDSRERWIENTAFPLFNAEGQLWRIAGFAKDVTERRETAERMEVLLAELQHRTRNLIGVVRAIADRTLADSFSLDGFRERFRDRMGALSRVNGLLSRLEGDDRIYFDELLRAELNGHGFGDEAYGTQIILEGPKGVRLRSSKVQILALVLHELMTNAMKYGALSRPGGRLYVGWHVLYTDEGERKLRVEWQESGVPVSTSPTGSAQRQGYGRELIERALPYQMGAETAYALTPEGVRCTIALPISSRQEESQND